MKATRIVIDRPGGPEVLRQENVELPEPGPGEVLVRHEAIGLNYIDTHHRNGRYPLSSYPSPLGIEAAGVIEAAGDGVSAKPGDRVAYSALAVGAYADRRIVPAEWLLPIPDALDTRVAAAALNKGLTAHYLCRSTHDVKAGDTILVHAAAGGVGSILCQWARHFGARVIGTAGGPAKVAFAREHGCETVIDYAAEDFVGAVRALAPGGVDVVYDAVGPSTFDGSLRCLRPRGLMVTYGTASGPLPPLDLWRLNQLGSLYVTSPGFATYTADPAERAWRAQELFAAIVAGVLRVPLGRSYALSDAAQAHTDLQARHTTGACVLIP